ncbi:MAG: hypothetical protein SGILL_004520 [Bacillariaceae sp.]
MTGYFLQQQQQQQEEGGDDDPMLLKQEKILSKSMPSSPREAELWLQKLRRQDGGGCCDLVAVVCESDPGLANAEQLGEWLHVTHQNYVMQQQDDSGSDSSNNNNSNSNSNNTAVNEARRNKYLMMEALQAASIRIPVVQQQLCASEEEAVAFAEKMGVATTDRADTPNTRVVVKPVRGCASDDVFLCDDIEKVKSAFRRIHGSILFASQGKQHDSVLVQEFAVGQEFAIDTVSKNGKMKIAAIWQYDKRPANGAPFVYYATKLLYSAGDDCNDDSSEMIGSIIYDYLDDCFKALDIQWGITHTEVILTNSTADGSLSPRLIEVNCRQHNMNFLPLTMGGIGYNVLDMLLAAYLGNDNDDETAVGDADDHEHEKLDWDLLPDIPATRMNAAMIHLVNAKKGILTAINEAALYEIQGMESVYDLEVYGHFLEAGQPINPTIDIKTDAGWVQLIHPDPEVFERDYRRIVELMPTLFEVEGE